jgi:hypothetical protein
VLGPYSNGDNQYGIVTDPPSYWEIPPGKEIVLQFNNSYQSLGLGAEKSRRSCGKLIRTGSFVHMRDEWGNVDPNMRQRLWEALMVCCIHNTLLIYIYSFVCFLLCCFRFSFFPKRMEPIQTKQRGRYVYVKCSFVYYLFIYLQLKFI